jgi:hypothetical protein
MLFKTVKPCELIFVKDEILMVLNNNTVKQIAPHKLNEVNVA